jgi:hypothetical protein
LHRRELGSVGDEQLADGERVAQVDDFPRRHSCPLRDRIVWLLVGGHDPRLAGEIESHSFPSKAKRTGESLAFTLPSASLSRETSRPAYLGTCSHERTPRHHPHARARRRPDLVDAFASDVATLADSFEGTADALRGLVASMRRQAAEARTNGRPTRDPRWLQARARRACAGLAEAVTLA